MLFVSSSDKEKVKHVQVLLDSGRRHAFGNTHNTPLNVPPANESLSHVISQINGGHR